MLFKLRLCVAVVINLGLVNILDQQIKHDGFEEINRNKPVITESKLIVISTMFIYRLPGRIYISLFPTVLFIHIHINK